MPTTSLDDLEEQYAATVAAMPGNSFDSHDFIRLLAHRHQHLYIQALAASLHRDYPFSYVHGEIARRLQNHPELVEKRPETTSADIFGQVNSAVVWAKR